MYGDLFELGWNLTWWTIRSCTIRSLSVYCVVGTRTTDYIGTPTFLQFCPYSDLLLRLLLLQFSYISPFFYSLFQHRCREYFSSMDEGEGERFWKNRMIKKQVPRSRYSIFDSWKMFKNKKQIRYPVRGSAIVPGQYTEPTEDEWIRAQSAKANNN